jgi:hypothetical protein
VAYFVLAAWVFQGAVGVRLLVGWLGGRRNASTVLSHAGLSVGALGPWIAFLATADVVWGWMALGLITVGNTLGDSLLRNRWRRLTGIRSSFVRDYAGAVHAVLTGRLPVPVVVHALFAGVVYIAALAACVAASTS